MKRDFEAWLENFRPMIADYSYYIDFNKVIANTDAIRDELNLLNGLIGKQDIEAEFIRITTKFPQTLKCIPILLAVRQKEIYILDGSNTIIYDFASANQTAEQYKVFMRETGLFELLQHHLINNLIDYVFGVETGLDSNGRKNRGGHLMENFVEGYIKKANVEYYKEMYLSNIEDKWDIDLSALSNNGKASKRFDFVVKTSNNIYAIETNFYSGGGSKLNETARSYKMLAEEAKRIKGFTFVWFTDGAAWRTARRNLQETFDIMEHLYSISDIENGIMKEIFK